MCGRFTQQRDASDLATRFDIQTTLFSAEPRYNVAPSQTVAVVVRERTTGERILEGFQWGLVPSWAKDPTIGSKMINARSETVVEKPAYKKALRYRRCIVPADGFYEWAKVGDGGKIRQPYHFRRKDGALFGFAGLWERWESPDSSPLLTCTLLTTGANSVVAPIHERMPVILQTPEMETHWLDPALQDPDALLPLLAPYPEDWMEAIPVSRRVNSPAADEPDLLERIPGI